MTSSSDIPCGTCRDCCRRETIQLHPEDGDIVARYDTVDIVSPITGLPAKALRQQANGDCIYLGPEGCTIHGHHPAMCRHYDCRRHFLSLMAMPRPARRRLLKNTARLEERFEIGRALQEKAPL